MTSWALAGTGSKPFTFGRTALRTEQALSPMAVSRALVTAGESARSATTQARRNLSDRKWEGCMAVFPKYEGCADCLTFDRLGGAKGAKRPLARPLDGGVRRHRRAPCAS